MLLIPSLKTSLGRAKKLSDQEMKKLVVWRYCDLQELEPGRSWSLSMASAKTTTVGVVTTRSRRIMRSSSKTSGTRCPDAPVWAAFERQFAQVRG